MPAVNHSKKALTTEDTEDTEVKAATIAALTEE
jgi:hypothetical protein